MTRRFEATTFITATAEEAFDWIADYRNVPHVLDGVSKWEPRGRKTKGEGARFDVEMKTLGIPVSAELELVEWRRPERIAWRSVGGLIRMSGAWDITERVGGVDVELTIEYEPPVAAVGNLLAGPVERVARGRLQAALDRMGDHLAKERA